MPIYPFKCTNPSCGHRFDIHQQTYITVAMTSCPQCGSPAAKQLSSAVYIRIK